METEEQEGEDGRRTKIQKEQSELELELEKIYWFPKGVTIFYNFFP